MAGRFCKWLHKFLTTDMTKLQEKSSSSSSSSSRTRTRTNAIIIISRNKTTSKPGRTSKRGRGLQRTLRRRLEEEAVAEVATVVATGARLFHSMKSVPSAGNASSKTETEGAGGAAGGIMGMTTTSEIGMTMIL